MAYIFKSIAATHFIALIHPIQWTIAYPVGADRPAKRQKKTSCVSTGQAGPVLCTRQMACRTSFLSRQSDVIASFSFGAHAVYTDISDRPPVDLFVEEGELSDQDLEASAADPDLTLSEEQNYRETMSGIRSFMGWTNIPEMDTTASRSEDNSFAGPKTQPTGKISVSMPTNEWLCSKMGKLNITLTEGYPSRSSEAGGLLKDHFIALIHPIQWTIALPVGATGPAKRQKKTSCI